MLTKRTIVLTASLAAVAAGSAGAIAATSARDEAKQAESEILSDAAKRLGVQSDELRKALAAAQDAQLDKAVKAGKLTQEQADAIKKRRAADGSVLRLGPGPGMRGHHRHGFRGGPGGRGASHEALAKALGITEARLHERLHAGKTIAEIAKDEGKNLDAVKAAMKKAVTDQLEADVKAGRLTDAHRDEIVKGLDARIDAKVNGRGHGPRGRGRHGKGRPGFLPGPGGPPPVAPGAFEVPAAPEIPA